MYTRYRPTKAARLLIALVFLPPPSAMAQAEPQRTDTAAQQTDALKKLLASVPVFHSDEFKDRDRLVQAASALGDKQVEVLSGYLLDDQETLEVRVGAAYALGEIGDKRAVPALLKALGLGMRMEAGKALGKIDDERIVPELVRLYSSKNEDVSGAAWEAIGGLRRKSSIPQLLPLLKHSDPGLRGYAAQALGTIGDASAVAALCALLNDKNDGVVTWTAQALGKIGDPAANAALQTRLQKGGDVFVRKPITDALEAIKEKVALRRFSAPGKSPVEGAAAALKDRDAVVRRDAIVVLKQPDADSDAVIPLLAQALRDTDDDVRKEAANALNEKAHAAAPEQAGRAHAAVAALIGALKGPKPEVRRLGLAALTDVAPGLEGRAALPAVMQSLTDADSMVRTLAAQLLGMMGESAKEAVPGLIAALRDKDEKVAGSAALALGYIGTPAVPALIRALKDGASRVRYMAAFALGTVGVVPGAHVLGVGLSGANGKDAETAAAAAIYMFRMGKPAVAAVPALTVALSDTATDVREAAVNALFWMGPGARAASPALRRIIRSRTGDYKLRAIAVATLGGADKSAAPTLLAVLMDSREKKVVRQGAAMGLVRIGKSAVPILRRASKSRDAVVRAIASEELQVIPDLKRMGVLESPE